MLKTTFIFLILIHIFGSLTLASISPLIRQRFGFNKNPKQENVFGKRNSSFRDWINASLRGADIAKKDGGSRRSENANEEVLVKTDQVINGEEGTVDFIFREISDFPLITELFVSPIRRGTEFINTVDSP